MVARRSSGPRHAVVRSWDAVARDLVRSGVTWRVHSVFRAAFNLVSDRRELLGIVTAPAGNGPATLVLARSALTTSLSTLLRPGQLAQIDGGWLRIEDRLAVDLGRAALWSPEPTSRTVPADEVLARLERVAAIAASGSPPDGLAPLLPEAMELAGRHRSLPTPTRRPPLDFWDFWSRGVHIRTHSPVSAAMGGRLGGGASSVDPVVRAAHAALAKLVQAIRAHDWPGAAEPARALSGLGPGLTPSGDDLLVGLALGLRAGLGTLPPELASALLAAVEGRTTDLAEARVRHAVAGRPDEAVHNLLVALLDGPRDRVEPSVRSALAYGHSSGADTLVGLVVGLALSTAPGRRLPGG